MRLPDAPRTLVSREVLADKAHTRLELCRFARPEQPDLRRVVARRPDASAVLAVNSRDQVLLIRQYREAVSPEEPILEIPAGKVDPGETPLEAVIRELGEETNLQAQSYELIKSLWASPGWTDERMHIYLARGVTATHAYSPDEDEEIELHWMELDRALEATQDAKSLIALYYLKSQRSDSSQ